MTKIIKPQTLKGFRDFLPEETLKRQYVIEKVCKVFESYGYDPIETPALEYADVLLGKYGEEADKLIYLFRDRGGRKIGLRFDQTVPTARFISQYQDKIPLPFKRYQIQLTWRQEKPQKGRYREFLQIDGDIFGLKTSLADAEIIAVIYDIYKALGFKKFTIKINTRNMLFSLMKEVGIPKNKWLSVIRSIDKEEKIGLEKVSDELKNKRKVSRTMVDKLCEYITKLERISGIKYFKKGEALLPSSFLESFDQPLKEIKEIFMYLEKLNVPFNKFLSFNPTLARGLDYYTSTIFEVEIPGYKAGSVLGGGRFDNLVKQLSGIDIPGVGFGLGFDRTLEAMEQFNLLPRKKTSSQVLVTTFSPDYLENSIKLAGKLRQAKINTDLYSDPETKLDKQLKYADKKGIPYVVILGPEEIKEKEYTLKDMKTGTQKKVNLKQLIRILNSCNAPGKS